MDNSNVLRLKPKERKMTLIRKVMGINKHERLPNSTYRNKLKSFPKSTKYVLNIHGMRHSLK